jgi:hypothetical protein
VLKVEAIQSFGKSDLHESGLLGNYLANDLIRWYRPQAALLMRFETLNRLDADFRSRCGRVENDVALLPLRPFRAVSRSQDKSSSASKGPSGLPGFLPLGFPTKASRQAKIRPQNGGARLYLALCQQEAQQPAGFGLIKHQIFQMSTNFRGSTGKSLRTNCGK